MAYKIPINLLFKKVDPRAVVPEYAHPGEDVALDATVISVKYDVDLDAYVYDTGWSCATKTLAAMFAHPKSSNCKHDFYLTNSVGIIDTKGYRGTVKAVFKHRDSLRVRMMIEAMKRWDELPWYKKFVPGSLNKIQQNLIKVFLEDPCKYAPYQPGDKAFQFWLADIKMVEITQTKKLPKSSRGEKGYGSSDGKQVVK